MASSFFSAILNKSHNLAKNSLLAISYCTVRQPSSRRNLFSRISPLGDPSVSVIPVLDKWVEEGNKVKELELQRIIRGLRGHRRFTHALEVSKWMSSMGIYAFSPSDRAVQLDLIGKVHGLEFAESYFQDLSDQDKTEKTYGALLNCYVREGLIDKSLSHLQKMKDMGFSSPLNYNNIMCLYTHSNQHEKVPDVLSQMKVDGVSPDIFSYRICISSYGARSDLDAMEKLLLEIERQPHISTDWMTYSMVANFFIKAGIKEKALIYLSKCEHKVHKDALGYNHLISHYGSLGNKKMMMRLWALHKDHCKRLANRDYITILGSLVKLGELEEAEKLLEEWESSCYCYDFRVPNILLIGYSQKGLIGKADTLLRDIVKKGKTPTPNSWSILATGYVDKQDMEKAFDCLKEALVVRANNRNWRPKPRVILSVLGWLGDNRDIVEIEDFVNSLKPVMSFDRDMNDALIKVYTRNGKEVDGILEKMDPYKIVEDEETEKILSSR
ncbi:putative Pentatricopeptide repeat-containing protein [Quillaja saponaria]|uniref:Pentatricopeptide repeat-containing protein n=1 Tax=Quillaja saponaria TaxID=32244 RepID=A0AAD7PAP5_QUISA|nr:putative Pentatricopeptide repeat-containing protein [Quillaja saponaria]